MNHEATSPLKELFKRTASSLPKTDRGDYLHHLAYFYAAHRRFPSRRSGLFNDYMFFLKNSKDFENPLRQVTSDKCDAKLFVDQILGWDATPKTFAVVDRWEDFDVDRLPDRCVIKPAHLSGVVVPFERGVREPTQSELTRLRASLDEDIYPASRERNYRHLRRRLIVEEMISDGPWNEGSPDLKDYKLHCFEGEPRVFQVISDRSRTPRRNLYTADWDPIDIDFNLPRGAWEPVPPRHAEMVEAARRLSSRFNYVRVDFFATDERLFVGELTHCNEQGHARFGSLEQERVFSRALFGSLDVGARAAQSLRST